MKDRNAAALFGVVVYNGVEPIDIGGTVGVVSMARRVLPAIESVTIAETAGPVELAGGLTILAQAGFARVAGWGVAQIVALQRGLDLGWSLQRQVQLFGQKGNTRAQTREMAHHALQLALHHFCFVGRLINRHSGSSRRCPERRKRRVRQRWAWRAQAYPSVQ